MSDAPTPKLKHAHSHARRELEHLERRLANGNFKHEALGRMKWAVACQRLIVDQLGKLVATGADA